MYTCSFAVRGPVGVHPVTIKRSAYLSVDAYTRSSLRQVTIGGNDGIAIHAGAGGNSVAANPVAAAAVKPKALPAPAQVCSIATLLASSACCANRGCRMQKGAGG